MVSHYWISEQILPSSTSGPPALNSPVGTRLFATSRNNDDTLVRASIEGSIRVLVRTDDPTVDVLTEGWWLNIYGMVGLWHDNGRGITPRGASVFSPLTDPDPDPHWVLSASLDVQPAQLFEETGTAYSYGIQLKVPPELRTSHAQRTNTTSDKTLAQKLYACFQVNDYLFPLVGHTGPPDYHVGCFLYARSLWSTKH